ncbi:MAG: hypothetical protein ACOY45_02040 [Pseudomonadota bacterium]
MTRGLILADGVALLLSGTGLTLLVRPAFGRRALGVADGEAATYGLRILGAMLFAAGLFCAGFANAYHWASVA